MTMEDMPEPLVNPNFDVLLSGSSPATMEEMREPPVNPNFDDDEEDQTLDPNDYFNDDDEDQTSDPNDDEEEDETSDLDNDDEEDERKIKNFMKDLPSRVSFRRPKSKYHLWSFWSEPTLSLCSGGSITDSATHTPNTNQPIITDIIKSALLHFDQSYFDDQVLIQFWAPITTETGCVQLVTSDQPFALTYDLDERLLNYRKQSLQYKFNVDGEEVEGLGIPGRVFRQKWHEYLPDVRHYSTKEYPQRDFALACHISKSFCFPLFQTSFQECVGVLEFATITDSPLYWTCKSFIELAGLKTSWCDGYDCISKVLDTDDHPDIWDEIEEGLEVVCKTHDLPLANTWIPCGHFNGLAFDGNLDNSYDTFDVSCMGPAFHFNNWNDFQRGHGVVGSAYQSHKPCFCKDITQFSITEYPSLPFPHAFGLTGCFAICLQSIFSDNYDYIIIEFFLNPKNTYGEDPTTFLCPILETMKQHFPNFKLASGEELGKELSIEVIKPRMNQEPTSFQCQRTSSESSPSNRPGALQNGQEMMQPHSSNQQPIVEVDDLNNDWHVVDAEQNNGQEQNNVPIRLEVSHNGQETTWPDPPHQQLTYEVEVDDINDGRNVNANSITYEKLEKHFGKKLEYVAQIFGVSRSTFKRMCRDNKINRWPRSKRKKVEGSPSRREPPCSDLPTTKLVAHHMTPLVRPPPEARTMTIKATYADDLIKFQLPFSSSMVDLEEEVSKRLKFHVGTYKIKYTDDDGDRVLIACDKDLQDCMNASNSLGTNTIKMFIEPINRISPLA
ncbi:protein NLP7-like [Cornus florida]|uniref:protein NLP7-like n=1 Tax=Cornus florida TaxID=4283 RepID=UPI0028A0A47F|nr:protein NLP7-like [Cornus florida]